MTLTFQTVLLIAALVLFIVAAIVAWPTMWIVLACAGLACFAAAHLP